MQDLFRNIMTEFSDNSFFIIRMILAALCGAMIGLERSRRQKDAGIRTHMIVALGAALSIIVSKYGFFDVVSIEGISTDASRIASNVITGVGFLGAGVIFVKDVSIKGLTTAAGIWTTAAVGLAIGAGLYTIGISATILMIIFQVILHRFFSGLENTVNEFTIVIKENQNTIDSFKKALSEINISLESCKMKRNIDGTVKLDITIKKSRSTSMAEIIELAQKYPDIIEVDI